jgi:hypothetical protein
VLRRWEESGATWQVRVRTAQRLEVALLSCDAGEEMGRLRSVPPDPEVVAYLSGRNRSDEEPLDE